MWGHSKLISVTSLSLTNQTQEAVGLSTLVEEKLILADADNPIIYRLTSKGHHGQYLKSMQFLFTILANLSQVNRLDVHSKGLRRC